jgi:uncharacterized protein (DUF3820 family)
MQHNVCTFISLHIHPMKKSLYFAFLLVCALVLTGCASTPTKPIAFDQVSTPITNSQIGVFVSDIPKPNTYFPGASCLICLAAAEIANNKLTTFTKALTNEDLLKIKSELTQLLKAKGASIVNLPENFSVSALPDNNSKDADSPKKDFSSIRSQYKLDKLVVVNFNSIGMQRNYSGYAPTSAPFAKIEGSAYLIDLTTNKYQWFQPLDIQKGAEGEWDEAPQYPGLTNAYFQAVELSKDAVLTPFKVK